MSSRLLLEMRVAWVRAMLSLSPSSWDDHLRGGARNQVGYAQGVTQANAQVFAGSCRAPTSLGELFYPRELFYPHKLMHMHTCMHTYAYAYMRMRTPGQHSHRPARGQAASPVP